MTIAGYPSKDGFGTKLSTVVTPAEPIRSIEHLKGRQNQLEEIERALYAKGRHIFIYGDRGVGKSSLAATAAYQYQSPDALPIFVSGSADDTFSSIIANIATQALNRSKFEATSRDSSRSLSFRGFEWSSTKQVSPLDLAGQIKSIGDATELLKQVAAKHSQKPAVVVDEFDAIPHAQERARFAALLKQMGDQSVDLKFFFTGIGSSIDELLGAHLSAHRQLETIEIFRLGWEARRDIITDAAMAFGLEVSDPVKWRIAIISDGFPYYVHLIVEKMLWEAFSSDMECERLEAKQFQEGLRAAIRATHAELKRPYEKAVVHRPPEFEDVVWSTADGEDLIRPLKAMQQSYGVIVSRRESRPVLENSKYNEIVRKLKSPAFGGILQLLEDRSGWYTYTEKMLRGYVRMQAEANGVELAGERPAPRQIMSVGNTRTGAYGSRLPRGVDEDRQLGQTSEVDDH